MHFLLPAMIVLLLTPNAFSQAQFSGDLMGDSISITLDPQYPNPGETVTASLDDYSITTSGASIAWYLDGKEIPAYKNQRTITFTTDTVGLTSQLEVKLLMPNQPALSASRTIKPVYVDVIIEPQTYTPVFYAGRPLPVHGSIVNLTTLVHTDTGLIDSTTHTYNWQLNDTYIYGGPQKGSFRAQIIIPYGRSSIVTVTVQDEGGTVIARRLVAIPSVPVDLEFYEVSTLYGLSRKVVGEKLNLVGNSGTIRAVPYNFDTRAVGNQLFSEWSVDGRASQIKNTDPFEINLKREGVGSARINFKVRNLVELIQGDEQSFQVQF